MLNIVIFGNGGHARMVAECATNDARLNVAGFISADSNSTAALNGLPVLGTDAALPGLIKQHALHGFIVGIGDNHQRAALQATIQDRHPELQPVTAVHAAANVSALAALGPGCTVMPGASINCGAQVAAGCIINTNAVVEHDCELGAFASIGPGAALGGNCRIGREAAIGIGASVLHNISIGSQTVIGAGAAVVADLAELQVAFGNPARAVRARVATEPYL